MQVRSAIIPVLILGVALLAGCSSSSKDDDVAPPPAGGLVPVQERNGLPYDVKDEFSHTLAPGAFGILPGISVDVTVSLPPTSGADGVAGLAVSNLGLFLPQIEGCDWTASELPAECHVPVIADVGPYYSSTRGQAALQTEGDTIATEPANRLGKFLIDNFVPHGYAVAQVSVLGTGDSTSCQDLMGRSEQAAIDQTVTWLGSQPWSNGNVSLIGRSYDGSTPWEAATFGNPALKTIVPISGLTGVRELMFHNGSSESRGAGLLYAIYAAMTVDGDASDSTQGLCPETVTGGPEGVAEYLAGSHNDDSVDKYWADRHFLPRALENYNGSIYFIHGLQDWNVEPHMAFPGYQQAIDAGLEVKGLFGQWGHMYPDRAGEHGNLGNGRGAEAYPESVRYDWAQDLLEWFDHYLKGTGPQPQLHAEVQDNQGAWRIETTWPPNGATVDVVVPNLPGMGPFHISETQTLTLPLGVVNETSEVRIAGLPHLDLYLAPTGPGGQVYARLADATGMHLGHAILELRSAEPNGAVVPAMAKVYRLEFEPMDVVLAPGTELVLTLSGSGEDYLPSPVAAPVQLFVGAEEHVLHLPTVTPSAGQFFTPPVGAGSAGATAPQP